MSVSIQALSRFIKAIEECDKTIDELTTNRSLSQGMKDALIGASIERKNMLLDQMQVQGVNIDITA